MRRALTFVVVTGAVAAAWILVLPAASVTQPLAFDHARHTAIACAVCHRGVEVGRRAGLPQSDVCVKCHATAPRVATAVQWTEASHGARLLWVRVSHVPDHVLFSHQRHVAIGRLDCRSCHADIGERSVPPGAVPMRLSMATCLSCHRQEGASEDCAACHR